MQKLSLQVCFAGGFPEFLQKHVCGPCRKTCFLHIKSKTLVSTELKFFQPLACYKVFLFSYIISSKLHELPLFDLPDNSCRTHLRPTGADGSEYINASFVDVCLKKVLISKLRKDFFSHMLQVQYTISTYIFLCLGIQTSECLHSNSSTPTNYC